MAATRSVPTAIPTDRPAAVAGRALLAAALTVARRIGAALGSVADSGQLGPQPDAVISRSTGGRI